MSSEPPAPVATPLIEHDALPAGTRFGELEIIRVLGVGGFGIVYLARDHALERHVALKEYMPASLARRGAGPTITVRSDAHAQTYAVGLRSFVNEARLLARFDHPSLVKVYRFWEDNATAYMVMPYLQGRTLRDVRRSISQAPSEAWIRQLLGSLLSAMELLHSEGVYHRDIAPDNILLPPDGPPILLDFGAARRVISDRTQTLTAILKPNYAPIEQYAEMAQLRQGPWTDIYALGAVAHFLLWGLPPPPATARAVHDTLTNLPQRLIEGISPRLLGTVAWMLAVRPQHRPQNVEALREVLEGRAPVPEVPAEPELPPSDMTLPLPDRNDFPPTLKVDPHFDDTPAAEPGPDDTIVGPAGPRPRVPAAQPMPRIAARTGSSRRWRWVAGLGGAAVVAAAAAVMLWPNRPAADAAVAPPAAAVPADSVGAAVVVATGASADVQPQDLAAAPAAPLQGQPAVVAAEAPVPATVAASSPLTAEQTSKARAFADALMASASSNAREVAPPADRPAAAVRRVPPQRSTQAQAPAPAPTIETAPAAVNPPPEMVATSGEAVADADIPATARQACGKRVFIALWSCMDRECERPRYREQPECVKVLETKRQRGQ